jgi:hypothetical protein
MLTRRITNQAVDIRDFLRKGLAVAKQMKKTKHPATKKRGADPQVPPKSKKDIPSIRWSESWSKVSKRAWRAQTLSVLLSRHRQRPRRLEARHSSPCPLPNAR